MSPATGSATEDDFTMKTASTDRNRHDSTASSVRLGVALLAGLLAATTGWAQTGGSDDLSPFIQSIPVGSSWQDVTANEGNNLRIHYEAIAFSGGGTANGRTVVFGGGHNNGMNDAVAFLDWRNFETVGWTEELMSTADLLGVGDFDYSAIGQHLNANYNPATPGGIVDSRGPVALSRHTYDQVVVRDDHFYIFAGVLPFDNPGQPSPRWANDEGDIWRYDFGRGWSFVGDPLALGYTGHAAATADSLTGDIWVHDGRGLRRFDTSSGTVGAPGDYLDSQAIESWLNFNPEKGAEGTLIGAGNYAGQNWHEYDIATGQQRNMGPVPGDAGTTYIIYVDSSYGPNYGTYFALVPRDGTLRRWNGSGWDTIATGAPSRNDYVYGRAGFEEVHQVFYWVTNSYSGNDSWKTYVVRPYAYNADGAPPPPLPGVSLSANPPSVGEQGSTTLEWNSSNADSCNASGGWSGARETSGSEVVGPLSADVTYSLACSGPGGTGTDSVTVTVVQAQPAPAVDLSANPATIDEGGATTLDWTTANASSCVASGDWDGAKPMQGSESVGPLAADAQFSLTCEGAGGEATDSVTVTVAAASPPPDPPEPVPPEPEPEMNGGAGGTGTAGAGLLLLCLVAGLRRVRRAA
jgi:hypothetical protein